MDINESITIDEEALFCPTGNSLALQFLSASRDAVRLSGIERTALLELLKHRYECPACNAM